MPQQHRFVKSLARALRHHCGVRAGDGLLLAVSGGADSVALLRAMVALNTARTWRLRLAVGHVQHHLRPDAQAENDARFVEELATRWNLPYWRLDLDPAQLRAAGNIEAAARRERYRALAEMARTCDARGIVTAHHADDQLETLLMRLLRGSSIRGLRGIAWRRTLTRGGLGPGGLGLEGAGLEGAGLEQAFKPSSLQASPANPKSQIPNPKSLLLLRPMLAVTRAEVRQFLTTYTQPWREDHTNADVSRWRAKLRAQVLPVLKEIRPDAAAKAVTLAAHLREVQRVLDGAIAAAADHVVVEEGSLARSFTLDRVDMRTWAAAVRRGLLHRLLRAAGVPADRLGRRVLNPILRACADTIGGERVFNLGAGVKIFVRRDVVKIQGKKG